MNHCTYITLGRELYNLQELCGFLFTILQWDLLERVEDKNPEMRKWAQAGEKSANRLVSSATQRTAQLME